MIVSIGKIRPVQTARVQTQEEIEASNAAQTAYLQQQFDDYNSSYDDYNSAVERYRQAEDAYNTAIEQLNAAQQTGRSSDIQATGIKAAGTAAAVNDALDNLQQKETAYNNSLLNLVNSGIITAETARQNQIQNTYTRLDVDSLTGSVQNTVSHIDSINDYNSMVVKLQKAEKNLDALADQYNAATTEAERAAIRDKYNAEVDLTNENITKYNIALRQAQNNGQVDVDANQIAHIPKLVATPGVSEPETTTEPATTAEPESKSVWGKTFFGTASNILSDLGAGLQSAADKAKLSATIPAAGIALAEFGARNLNSVAEFTGNIENKLTGLSETIVSGSAMENAKKIQESLYNAGQWVNPSDENVIAVREEKIAGIESIADNLQKSALSDAGTALSMKQSDNPLVGALGTSLLFGSLARSYLISGGKAISIEAVSEKQTEAEQKQQAISNVNTLANAVGTAGDMLPTREGRFLADALESGIRQDADYLENGLIDAEGNVHSPGILHGTAAVLTGGAIGSVAGSFAAPTISAAKSLAGDLLGIGASGTGAGLTLEGISTSEYMASRGIAGAGRGASGSASVVTTISKSATEPISAANVVSASMLGNDLGGISKIRNVDFTASELGTPTKNTNRERISNDIGMGNSILDNIIDEYPTRNRTGTGNRYRSKNEFTVDLGTDIFNDSPTTYREPTRRRYGSISESVFGDTFGNNNRNEYRNDYIYDYEYPASRPTRKARELSWDDDDILSESRSRKRKSSRNDIWREILRL